MKMPIKSIQVSLIKKNILNPTNKKVVISVNIFIQFCFSSTSNMYTYMSIPVKSKSVCFYNYKLLNVNNELYP